MKKFLTTVLLVWFSSQSMATPPTLDEVLQSPHRPAEHKARDVYRHPKQTLKFFDIKPYMTVVEIWPGAGWYTEILAPYLREEGQLYAAHFSPDSKIDYFKNSAIKFRKKQAAQPKIYDQVKITVLELPKFLDIAPAGSADRVLTFRNVHNWLKAGVEDEVFSAMYKALRPGGLLGVVEHRASEKTPVDPQAKSGYVHEKTVITIAEKAGFKLLDKSDINRNTKDNTDHPKGVWSLLPTLRLGEQDKEKYQSRSYALTTDRNFGFK